MYFVDHITRDKLSVLIFMIHDFAACNPLTFDFKYYRTKCVKYI